MKVKVDSILMRTVFEPKADPGPARRARSPRVEKNGLVFVNFHCITQIL